MLLSTFKMRKLRLTEDKWLIQNQAVRKGLNPTSPDSGVHIPNADVGDKQFITTGVTRGLQSLIHNSEIQKVLKIEKKKCKYIW